MGLESFCAEPTRTDVPLYVAGGWSYPGRKNKKALLADRRWSIFVGDKGGPRSPVRLSVPGRQPVLTLLPR